MSHQDKRLHLIQNGWQTNGQPKKELWRNKESPFINQHAWMDTDDAYDMQQRCSQGLRSMMHSLEHCTDHYGNRDEYEGL